MFFDGVHLRQIPRACKLECMQRRYGGVPIQGWETGKLQLTFHQDKLRSSFT